MRNRIHRHLGAFFSFLPPTPEAPRLFTALDAPQPALASIAKANSANTDSPLSAESLAAEDRSPRIPLEFSPHQYVIFLLHIAAEIEHALMVEYLYAAYTLGGPQVPEAHRADVTRWQEIIAGIAKEEMGHLMTVQNLLRALGGPLNLDREDFPWDSGFVPFPFRLEPLTRQSLARFVLAESPVGWSGTLADTITELAKQGISEDIQLHHVGELYALLRTLISDPTLIPDSCFRADTFPYQANWDEWGRGYKGGARGNSTGGSPAGTPDVLLLPIGSRTDALSAIDQISTQGEACPSDKEDAPSHFARFLSIFNAFPDGANWAIRPAPLNPIVPTGFTVAEPGLTPITNPEAQLWGSLLNVRYQILLASLLHTFDYPSNLDPRSQMTPRGLLVHSTFGEMYNLRAISLMLVQTPLNPGETDKVAGPPFQMPYTLELPIDSVDRWRVHLDLFESSRRIVDLLLKVAGPARHTYLHALLDGDSRTAAAIQAMIRGDAPAPAMPTRR